MTKEQKPSFIETPQCEEIKQGLLECVSCSLSKTRTKVALPRGSAEIPIMFVGEMPGPDEDKQGTSFIGRAGAFLDKVCLEFGLDTNQCYITNTCKCYAGKIIVPDKKQADTCRAHLMKEIRLIKPYLIVALGLSAYKTLTGDSTSQMKNLFGQLTSNKLIPAPILTIYHPSWYLRASSEANLELYRYCIRFIRVVFATIKLVKEMEEKKCRKTLEASPSVNAEDVSKTEPTVSVKALNAQSVSEK